MVARLRHLLGAEMGNPSIYWYPDPLRSLERIDFGESLSDLQITQIRDASDAYSRSGRLYRTLGASRLQIRLILENFTNEALRRDLESLVAHLKAGGPVGFSLDHDKSWAGFIDSMAREPSRGSTVLKTKGNRFTRWSGSASLGSGEEIVIASAPLEGLKENRALSGALAASATSVNITSDPLIYSYRADTVVVRHRDFYPCLVLPETSIDDAIVETNHRISYTLDLTLDEDWGTLSAIHTGGYLLRSTDAEAPELGHSLQQIRDESISTMNDAYIAAPFDGLRTPGSRFS